MGDISEMRGIIIVATVFFSFALILSLMPSQFYVSEVGAHELPESLDAYNWLSWNASAVITILYNAANESEINGYNFHWTSVSDVWIPGNGQDTMIYIRTESIWWIFHWNYQYFSFTYKGQDKTTTAGFQGIRNKTIQDIFDSADVNRQMEKMNFEMSNAYITVHFNFVWNNTLYDDPSDALINNNLSLIINTNFSTIPSQLNVWSIITNIMTFQAFEGIPYAISTLLGLGLWSCIGYMAFIFVLRMIGAVFGGGGA